MAKTDALARALPASGEPRRGGRPPAGTDPRKRGQILEGAAAVFKKKGFDAAAMGDVATAAGVSKATLYVYYPSKEELFAAVIGVERDRSLAEILEVLDGRKPAEDVLREFGRRIVFGVTQPHVVQAHRIVLGVCSRMPEIGKQMYEAGARRTGEALASYLERRTDAGELAIDDVELAAFQFIDLCQSSLVRPRLYSAIHHPLEVEDGERVVASAVRMFLKFYRSVGT